MAVHPANVEFTAKHVRKGVENRLHDLDFLNRLYEDYSPRHSTRGFYLRNMMIHAGVIASLWHKE